MKKPILFFLLLCSQYNFAQSCFDAYYCLTFDDTTCLYHLGIDTSLSNNIWQVGVSHKPVLNFGSCSNLISISTDTVNPYPVNNHSAFTITNIATSGDVFGFKMFSGSYAVQSDSLNDYGTIEISLDNGASWIDIINDTVYSNYFMWFSSKPVLTGHTCANFSVDIGNLSGIQPINIGDTIIYRFSFFSDSIPDTLGGLMFDDICFFDFVEGVSQIRFAAIKSKIYPNPSERFFTIEFENPDAKQFQLAIYDICSKPMYNSDKITSDKVSLDLQNYPAGMYVYKIVNLETRKRSWGRFSVMKD